MSQKYTYSYKEISSFNTNFKENKLLIPIFQREYVWKNEQILKLLNSIYQQNPIGYVIIWKTIYDKNIDSNTSLINSIFPKTEEHTENTECEYILDGQQRLTTLSIIANLDKILNNINEYEKPVKNIFSMFKDIVFDLEDEQFKIHKKNIEKFLFLHEISNTQKELISFKKFEDKNEENNILSLRQKLNLALIHNLEIGVIKINDFNLEEAIDIFNKINTSGKKLSIFDMVFSNWMKSDIDLKKEIRSIFEENAKDFIKGKINDVHFEIFIDSLFLVLKDYPIFGKNEKIAYIPNNEDVTTFNKFKKSFKKAIKFLQNHKFNSNTLPSKNIIKWLCYLYFFNKDINACMSNLIEKYILFVSMNNRYSSSTSDKLKKDIEIMKKIINGEISTIDDIYLEMPDQKRTIEWENIRNTKSQGSMTYKIISWLLLNNGKDFIMGTKSSNVPDGDLQLHHIFPKAAKMNGKKLETIYPGMINSIANLSPITQSTNKKILNKLPSQYFNDPNIMNLHEENLKDSFIDIESFKNDDFEIFLDKRSQKIADKFNELLNGK